MTGVLHVASLPSLTTLGWPSPSSTGTIPWLKTAGPRCPARNWNFTVIVLVSAVTEYCSTRHRSGVYQEETERMRLFPVVQKNSHDIVSCNLSTSAVFRSKDVWFIDLILCYFYYSSLSSPVVGLVHRYVCSLCGPNIRELLMSGGAWGSVVVKALRC